MIILRYFVVQASPSSLFHCHNIIYCVFQNDSEEVEEVVMGLPGGPYQEYFYIVLPTIMTGNDNDDRQHSSNNNSNSNSNNKVVSYRRFVFVNGYNPNAENSVSNTRFPMQFGMEVKQQGCILKKLFV